MSSIDSGNAENQSLNDALAEHLNGCEICQSTIKDNTRPVPNITSYTGEPTKRKMLCPEWFSIIREWALHEGYVNNIVAKNEYGIEAWHQPYMQGHDD